MVKSKSKSADLDGGRQRGRQVLVFTGALSHGLGQDSGELIDAQLTATYELGKLRQAPLLRPEEKRPQTIHLLRGRSARSGFRLATGNVRLMIVGGHDG